MKQLISMAIAIGLLGCAPLKNSPFSEETASNPSQYNELNVAKLLSSAPSHGEEIVIGIIADTHQNYTDLQDWVSLINTELIDFSILLGDFTNQGMNFEYDTYLGFIFSLRSPHFTVIGNHDTLTKGKLLYRRLFGPYNFAFEYKGYKFIQFNNNSLDFGSELIDWEWLESQLNDSSLPKVVSMHINMDNQDYFTEEERRRFHELLSSHNVQLALNGHGHEFQTVDETDYIRHQVSRVEGGYWTRVTLSPSLLVIERCQKEVCTRDPL